MGIAREDELSAELIGKKAGGRTRVAMGAEPRTKRSRGTVNSRNWLNNVRFDEANLDVQPLSLTTLGLVMSDQEQVEIKV